MDSGFVTGGKLFVDHRGEVKAARRRAKDTRPEPATECMSGQRRAGVLALLPAVGSLVFLPTSPRRLPAAALCRRQLLPPLRVATAEPEAIPADLSANATTLVAAASADGAGETVEIRAVAPPPRQADFARLRRALWTPLDVGHTHAVSGALFLAGALAWIAWVAHAQAAGAATPHAPIFGGEASLAVLAVGVWNGLSALPMASDARVASQDLDRYHALAFRWGGTAQLVACAWLCWWFSGLYPSVPRPVDAALCVASMSSIAWVVYFSEESIRTVDRKVETGGFVHGRRAVTLSKDERIQLSALARLGSYPNVFQLPVLVNVFLGGRAWLDVALDKFPHQAALLHHYLFACAASYAITFFATTLRDRKLITIRQDLAMLATGTALPFLTMFADVSAFPGAATLNPLDYNVGFI